MAPVQDRTYRTNNVCELLLILSLTQGKLNSVHDNGPRADSWSSLNMPVTTLGASDADAILQQITANKAVAPPNTDYHVPFYSATNYAEQVTDWLTNRGDANESRSEVSFDFDTGNSVDVNSFNHTNVGGDQYEPWLSLGVNDDRCEESSMISYADQLQTTITMSWDDQFRAIDIQSGRWYVHIPSLHPLSTYYLDSCLLKKQGHPRQLYLQTRERRPRRSQGIGPRREVRRRLEPSLRNRILWRHDHRVSQSCWKRRDHSPLWYSRCRQQGRGRRE